MGRTSKRAKYLQQAYLASQQQVEVKEDKPWENVTLEERFVHQSWCFKNGIFIYFEPNTWREGHIVINDNGKIQRSSEIYNQVKLRPKDDKYWEIIWKLYSKFYYERN